MYQIITKRLEKLNKIENLTYSDIYAWSAENIEIFNELKLDTKWFVDKNLKIEIEKYINDKSFIILFNTEESEKYFYTTIINENEFLEPVFFENVKKTKNNNGYVKNIRLNNNKIEKGFLYLKNTNYSDEKSDSDEREKIYLGLLDKRIDKEISNIAIEDRFQQDINAVETIKNKSGPWRKK